MYKIVFCGAVLLSATPIAAQVVPAQRVEDVVVNAPVAPDAIYVGRRAAVSVIDLNGFGQGTGSPSRSNLINNPNIGRQGVWPPVALGTSGIDGGSAGPLSLTEDSAGRTDLLRGEIGSADDIHIGQPLDLLWNNDNRNPRASAVNQVNPATFTVMPGNTISVAPHPNPPRLSLTTPDNPERGIFGQESTITTSGTVPGRVTTSSPPCIPSPVDLLLLGHRFDGTFNGPQPTPPAPPHPFCPFTCRQQVGHFLYVVDRPGRRVHVYNSNRFIRLASIELPEPYSAAMSPNLRWLAVSNPSRASVSILDVDPRSPGFHRVLGEIAVGRGASGLAWQPEGEDLLVCNTLDDSVSIIHAATFRVRKVLRNGIRRPTEVATCARQYRLGIDAWTYFALIRNGDGTLAAYQSGPTPYGSDDSAPLPLNITGVVSICVRQSELTPAFAIGNTDQNGAGQIMFLAVVRNGTQLVWTTGAIFGGMNSNRPRRDQLSGNVVTDIAFDEIYNDGAAPDWPSVFPGLTYAPHSGKGQVKQSAGGPIPAHRARLMFVALPDVGRVDVIDVATGQKLTSASVPGVTCVSQYWRQ